MAIITDISPAIKDTSHSCIFQWPDRPPDTLPPEFPPVDPPACYPYCDIDDWPNPGPNPPEPPTWPPAAMPPEAEARAIGSLLNFNALFDNGGANPGSNISDSPMRLEIGPHAGPILTYDAILFPPPPSGSFCGDQFTVWAAGQTHEQSCRAHGSLGKSRTIDTTCFLTDIGAGGLGTGTFYFRLKLINFAPQPFPLPGASTKWFLDYGLGSRNFSIHFFDGLTPHYWKEVYGVITWDVGLDAGTIKAVRKRDDDVIDPVWPSNPPN